MLRADATEAEADLVLTDAALDLAFIRVRAGDGCRADAFLPGAAAGSPQQWAAARERGRPPGGVPRAGFSHDPGAVDP